MAIRITPEYVAQAMRAIRAHDAYLKSVFTPEQWEHFQRLRDKARQSLMEDEMLEIEVESRVCVFAQKLGWLHRKIQYVGKKNCPDRVFIHPKHGILFIEFKRPGAVPRKTQLLEMDRLKKAGARVLVIDSIPMGEALFRSFEE